LRQFVIRFWMIVEHPVNSTTWPIADFVVVVFEEIYGPQVGINPFFRLIIAVHLLFPGS
jgi:hypothetical protein